MSKWLKWKLVHKDGLTLKQYRQKHKVYDVEGREVLGISEGKCEPILLESGYPAILYDFGEWYGPFFAVLNAKDWYVVQK